MKYVFPERIKELRIERNLSVNELAKEIGVSGAAVSRWENCIRIPNLDNIYNLAKFFDVSADYLIGLTDFL